MTAGPVFGFTADRVCQIRDPQGASDTALPLDDDGFLDASEPHVQAGEELTPGALVAPHVAAGVGPLVLLGEPGIGKSTVFANVVSESGSVWVDAADLTDVTFHDLLGRHLEALPGQHDVPEGQDDPRVVVVDQIDESPIVRRLAGRIRMCLEDRDMSSLVLLLACRTADYPSNLTEALRALGADPLLVDLAPLTREQAIRLADSADGVDGAGLVEAAVEAGAGFLASVPLTLAMLVRTYRATGELEPDPRKLFADGVVQLADEHDDRRRGFSFETTVRERLAVAGRVAARMLLSGRRTLWAGAQLQSGSHDLRAEALVGGREPLDAAGVVVSANLVNETLATALFTGRGENRLAFRHGSIAAHLAARHIADRDVPRKQLERLFLVSSVEGSRSIPTLLRETAAWLVTEAPEHADWLVDADPESLSGHSRIVDSESTRALLVDALLARADEVELSNIPWARSPRRLAHPGLAEQLREVFENAGPSEPDDWSSTARIRLAVRLAREAEVTGLADCLLHLARSDNWGSRIRQLAAITAYETQPGEATDTLKSILDDLADPEHASTVDPDDELRGTLLRLLWPDHLAVEDVLPHMRPRRREDLFGMYLRFEREFPKELPEDDVPTVLGWARERTRKPAPPPVADVDEGPQTQEAEQGTAVTTLDDELVEGIINRALTGPSAAVHVDAVAALLFPKLKSYGRPPLPAPLDVVTAERDEPTGVRDLRRSLASELTKLMATEEDDMRRADAWSLISGWSRGTETWGRPDESVPQGGSRAGRTRLLDRDDFTWAFHEATAVHQDGDERIAQGLAEVASLLFDPTDVTSVDLVYEHRGGPLWDELRHWFEPVELDSERASRLREMHRRHVEAEEQDPQQEEPSSEALEFAAAQRRRLHDAADGDADAFWRLAWGMQFPPETLTGQRRLDDDLRDFPGVAVLDDEQRDDELIQAAISYIHAEHDHRDSWLGTATYDKRGWAGYLAFALLERAGLIDRVSDDRWSTWVGAIVWMSTVPVNAGDRELKIRLLKRAARYSPTELAQAAAHYLRGELALGRLASEIELIDPQWHPDIGSAWQQLVEELTEALASSTEANADGNDAGDDPSKSPSPANGNGEPPAQVHLPAGASAETTHPLSIWETMLARLVETDSDAEQLAAEVLQSGIGDDSRRPLAVRGALILLRHDAPRWWPHIHEIARQHPDMGESIATAGATSQAHRPLLADLPELELANVYRWLADLFPPDSDPHHTGAHFVSPKEQARQWRDNVLHQLADRGSPEAVSALASLKDENPDRLIISSNLIKARANAGESAWTPPHPDDLALLLEDPRRRLVRSNHELAEAVVEVLEDVANDIRHVGDLLWDRIPARANREMDSAVWLPKPEAALSALTAHELRHRLKGRGLLVNREVLVQQTDEYGAGDRTDILVESPGVEASSLEPVHQRVAVVVEVKGSWNEDVESAQRDQLAKRYLPEANTDHGVYLVGWYPLGLWTDERDYRRRRVLGTDRDDLEEELSQQARRISEELQVTTYPILLDVQRSRPTADNEDVEQAQDGDSEGAQ